jgi:hypothetical protein
MAEQLVDAFVAIEDLAAFGALEVLDADQMIEAFARADRCLVRADFAGDAEVETGVDADVRQARPGGVVAIVGERRAAFDRLAVADRDREEEVGAFAAVEQVGAAVVDEGVVPSASSLISTSADEVSSCSSNALVMSSRMPCSTSQCSRTSSMFRSNSKGVDTSGVLQRTLPPSFFLLSTLTFA